MQINATSNVNFQLHNQFGEIVYTIDSDHKNIEINAGLFKDNIYFLTCKTKHGNSQKKLIIDYFNYLTLIYQKPSVKNNLFSYI